MFWHALVLVNCIGGWPEGFQFYRFTCGPAATILPYLIVCPSHISSVQLFLSSWLRLSLVLSMFCNKEDSAIVSQLVLRDFLVSLNLCRAVQQECPMSHIWQREDCLFFPRARCG